MEIYRGLTKRVELLTYDLDMSETCNGFYNSLDWKYCLLYVLGRNIVRKNFKGAMQV